MTRGGVSANSARRTTAIVLHISVSNLADDLIYEAIAIKAIALTQLQMTARCSIFCVLFRI